MPYDPDRELEQLAREKKKLFYYPSCGLDSSRFNQYDCDVYVFSDYIDRDGSTKERRIDFWNSFKNNLGCEISIIAKTTKTRVFKSGSKWGFLFFQDNNDVLKRIHKSGNNISVFCGVCCGCSEGGNYECVNDLPFLEKIFRIMNPEGMKYITDHSTILADTSQYPIDRAYPVFKEVVIGEHKLVAIGEGHSGIGNMHRLKKGTNEYLTTYFFHKDMEFLVSECSADATKIIKNIKECQMPDKALPNRTNRPTIPAIQSTDVAELVRFLNFPVYSSDPIFELFNSLDNERKTLVGEYPERFIYLPGSRQNKVLLLAHADTVWQGENHISHTVQVDGDIITSSNPHAGLGADDRAGCAIIWLLKELGHSILITDGEEIGRIGSKYLMEKHLDIANEIQKDHQFAIQFDRRNGKDFKCYDVGTDEFRRYIKKITGYSEPDRNSFTDICTLCTEIAGVNLSIGYRNEHSLDEQQYISSWLNTLNLCRKWLSQDNLPRFER